MAIDWTQNYDVVMGWNQLVKITTPSEGMKPIKVKDFNVGIKQTVDVPELVTGSTDRNTWSKGVIEVGGNISAPLTASFASTIVKAANDVAPGGTDRMFSMSSSVHGSMVGCMVNSCRISAESGGPIEVQAEVWGRLGENLNSGTSSVETVVTSLGGMALGVIVAGGAEGPLPTEQIPMFDTVVIPEAFMPSAVTNMVPTAVTFAFENNLIRNYVLGVDGLSSLDAFSISAGQRKLSGTMTFMSGASANAKIAIVRNAGMSAGGGTSAMLFGSEDGTTGLIEISGEKYRPLWSAAPPSLNTQKVVIELEYVLVATEAGFHITIG